MRLSGPATGAVLDALIRGRPAPRRASLRTLRDRDGAVLDRGLVLWFPAPRSYTGEDCAELHLHGGRAVLATVAEALTELGARPAEAGEFTRRAFLNGRMDLLEAEGIADLVAAETDAQRQQALRQMDGELGKLYRGWTDRLRTILALQEALIDFPDDEVPAALGEEILAGVGRLLPEIGDHLADGRRGERLREGLVFAVVGPPNVGKSSLVNALAEREVAIVAPLPGTTRDALEARVDFGGVPVTLIDTAGLRDSVDPVEAEGVRRARQRARDADLVIAVFDASCPGSGGVSLPGALLVANKVDLAPHRGGSRAVSALTGAGMAELRRDLARAADEMVKASGPPPLTRARHRAHLHEAVIQLRAAQSARLVELRAESLRLALRSLGQLTGEVGTEDILDSIFSRFCIGK